MTRTFMDCSSAHLSPETWAWLDTQLADDRLRDPGHGMAGLLAGGRTRYGWLVFVPEDADERLPADLAQVCEIAGKRDAAYVLFDCGALPDQDLPVLHPKFQAAG